MSRLLIFFVLSFGVCAHSNVATNKDGGKAFRRPLNDGTFIPALGLGTFLGFDEKGPVDPKKVEVTQAVEWAIDSGYRLIDTAALYKDEQQIGQGIDNRIKAGVVKREDLFIVTKLPGTHHSRARVLESLQTSLKDLKLDYVDLYLIHWPLAITVFTDSNQFEGIDYLEAWQGMEDIKKLGLAKSIGISNFNISQIQRILDNSEIKPSVLQVEVNLNLGQKPLVDFCKSNGILVMAYTPFGSLFSSRHGTSPPPPRKDDPILMEIATKYKKTTPQVVLRYLVERGVVPIPKSVHKNRIEGNIDIFDFSLTPEEIRTLDAFDKNYRVVAPSFWQNHPYYPFEKTDTPIDNPFVSWTD